MKDFNHQLNLDIPASVYWDLPNPASDIWEYLAHRFSAEIIYFTKIDSDTEHQLDNFGPGSAWMLESPYGLGLTFTDDSVMLTVYSP